jgi:hypothetical protein
MLNHTPLRAGVSHELRSLAFANSGILPEALEFICGESRANA